MKKYLLACVVVTGFLNASANAQETRAPLNPMEVVPDFSVQTIVPVLQVIGAKATTAQSSTGQSFLQVEANNGLKSNILFMACREANSTSCKGLSISAQWDKVKNLNDAQILDNTRKFNIKYDFLKAGILDNGHPFIQRYAIADYGILQGNILMEIETFTTIASQFSKEALGNS